MCSWGFTGKSCNIVICPHDCSGHGSCTDGFGCACAGGYTGSTCETAPPGTFTERLSVDTENFPYRGTDGDRRVTKNGDAPSLNDGKVRPSQLRGVTVKGKVEVVKRVDTSLRVVKLPDPAAPVVTAEEKRAEANECIDNCNFHGMCQNGRCFCEPEYTGVTCGMDRNVAQKSQGLRKALFKIGNSLAKLTPQERKMLDSTL